MLTYKLEDPLRVCNPVHLGRSNNVFSNAFPGDSDPLIWSRDHTLRSPVVEWIVAWAAPLAQGIFTPMVECLMAGVHLSFLSYLLCCFAHTGKASWLT